jgi:cyclopropane-fatty-acyl-phospholipid synthase
LKGEIKNMASPFMKMVQWEITQLVGQGLREKVEKILEPADIKINGGRPWDIQVHDPRWFVRVLSGGSLALGESYMDGWWECGALDELFNRVLRVGLDEYEASGLKMFLLKGASKFLNRQSQDRAFEVGKRHYDSGNDLFKTMLDRRMIYTCGYWESAKNLDEAQKAKLDLVCRKLGLKPGQKILDIGCGWGGFMKYAAMKYKVECVGVTVSKAQHEMGQQLYRAFPPVKIKLEDYRNISGEFDHIVSLGMFEHVGYKNYRVYMEKAHSCLKKGGNFLLQTIGSNRSVNHCDPWFDKYIFPNGQLPSIHQIGESIEGLFVMEDWHNFGTDYDKTLRAWFDNFDRARRKLSKRYDERFYRMWRYYLLGLAGGFRARKNQLWQIVLSKGGSQGGYRSIR